MDDLVRLLDLLGEPDGGALSAAAADPPVAIATVVNTSGSAYRRPGARMVIRRSMSVQGAVSAGCLERDIIAHCEGLRYGSQPLLLTYDGSSSDDLVFGLKLGCDGIVQILLEPVGKLAEQASSTDFQQLRQLLSRLLSAHRRVVAVTLFDLVGPAFDAAASPMPVPGFGLVMLATGDKAHLLSTLPGPVASLLSIAAKRALADPQGRSFVLQQKTNDGHVSALIEIVQPITSLLIFGSGQDVDPLLAMAAVLGWRVTVVGNTELDRLGSGGLACLIDNHYASAAVVMTHDYERDRKILAALFTGTTGGAGLYASALSYIGVVGPRRRSDKLLAELALEGVPITGEQLSRFFSPVGLDLGAEGPQEIALSILAEIKAVLAGHRGGLLREKQGPIHEGTPVKTSAVGRADLANAVNDPVSCTAAAPSDLGAGVENRIISASCRLTDE